MYQAIFSALAPAGAQARLSTLIFHRVLPQPDPLQPGEVDARRFDQICAWLKRWFQVLPLAQAAQLNGQGRLPARPLCITFDDGYADNCEVAMPILQRHGLHATFFVTTDYLDGGVMWNDRVIEAIRAASLPMLDLQGLPGAEPADGPAQLPLQHAAQKIAAIGAVLKRIKHLAPALRQQAVGQVQQRCGAPQPQALMMRSAQVRELRDGGMGLGAHTMSHPILAALDDAAAEREIVQGREQLERIVEQRIGLFAYPNGKPVHDFTEAHVAMVRRAGFDAAVTTAWGVARRGTDPHQLPRFTPWDRAAWRFGLRLAQNLRQG